MKTFAFRYLVMDDMSSRAIEVLGSNLGVDPRAFTKHLHQSFDGYSIETMHQNSGVIALKAVVPEPHRRERMGCSSALHPGKRLTTADDDIYQVKGPTDIFDVPAMAGHVKKECSQPTIESI